MTTNKTQIAVAITAVIALLAGILLVVNNINSQTGQNVDLDVGGSQQGQSQINPLQAIPHTIASCDATSDARYAIVMGEFTSAKALFGLAEEQATLATSFDPKWQRLLTNVSNVVNSADFISLAQETADTTEPFGLPQNIDTIESICGSIIDPEITPDIAETMACVWVEHWNITKDLDKDNDLYRAVLSRASDYSSSTVQYAVDGTKDDAFHQNILELRNTVRSGDTQKAHELYESTSESCAKR